MRLFCINWTDLDHRKDVEVGQDDSGLVSKEFRAKV